MARLKAAEREKLIVDSVKEARRLCQSKMEPDRQRWEIANNLFQHRQDWGQAREEHPWMNRVFLPLFSSTIRQIAAIAHNTIFSQPEFVGLEVEDDQVLAPIIEKMLRYEIEQTKFKLRFHEGMLTGGIYGTLVNRCAVAPRLVVKPEVVLEKLDRQERKELDKIATRIQDSRSNIPQDEESIERLLEESLVQMFGAQAASEGVRIPTLGGKRLFEFGLEYSIVNPFNFFWLPDVTDLNMSPLHLEQSFLYNFQLAPLFDSGVLDKAKSSRVYKGKTRSSLGVEGATWSATDEGQDFVLRHQLEQESAFFPRSELIQYFGPLIDRDGMPLEENRHFIIANDVVVKDRMNPYFSQQSPYFTCTFSKVPGKGVGMGMVDGAIDHNLVINDLWSLYLDALQLAVLTPRVYDSSKIADISQLDNGIQPMALIEGTGDASKIFSEIPASTSVGQSVLQAIEFMRLSAEQGAAVDTQSTNPSSRARITAAEIQANQGRQALSQTTLGAIIDDELIRPFAQRVLGSILQWSFEDSNLHNLTTKGVISDAEFQLVKEIPKIERYKELSRNYKIKIQGFRDILERDQRAQRVTEFITVAAQNPQMSDNVDYKEVLKTLGGALNMDTDKLIRQNTPQDTAYEENRILADNKFIQPSEQEEHPIHLPIHYEQALKDPNQATIAHLQHHIIMAQQLGMNVPQPPPELEAFLGFGPSEETGGGQQTIQ